MNFGLTSLPVEVLGQILNHDGVGAGVLYLWQSGSYVLQRKVENCVTVVDLRNYKRFVRLQVPKFVANLRRLRVLRIDRDGKELRNLQDVVQTLQDVSPTLEELEMNFKGSAELCLPSYVYDPYDMFAADGLTVKPYAEPRAKHINLVTTFPRLQRLAFDDASEWSPGGAQHLPPTLTSLSIPLPDDENECCRFLANLPSSLLSLRLSSSSCALETPLLKALPPNLTHLDASATPEVYDPDYTLSGAPQSLVQVNYTTSSVLFTARSLATLPPLLEHLPLYIDEDVIELEVATIPPAAKHLTFWQGLVPTTVFNTLPRDLVSLQLQLDFCDDIVPSFDGFTCLKKLVLTAWPGTTPIVFPASLVELEVELRSNANGYANVAFFEKLPGGLTSLSVMSHYMDRNIALPPNLKHLSLTASEILASPITEEAGHQTSGRGGRGGGRGGTRGRGGRGRGGFHDRPSGPRHVGLPFSSLPNSLESLQTSRFETHWPSLLDILPTALKSLTVQVFAPYSTPRLPSLEIFTRLPRKLEELSIQTEGFTTQPEDFAFLPPTLTSLKLHNGQFPNNPDALLHLSSFPTLSYLEMDLESLSEVHLASLPKCLDVARFQCSDDSWERNESLCRSVASSFPLEADVTYFSHTRLANYVNAHRQTIMQALHDPDPTEFIRLTQYMKE